MIRSIAAASGLALLLSACASTAAPAPPKARKVSVDCSRATEGAYWLTVDPAVARQGEELKVGVWKAGQFPGSETAIPAACLTDWQVSDPSAVEVASDGHGLRIAKAATPGKVVELSAAIAGARPKLSLTIVGVDEVTLAGLWTQVDAPGCAVVDPPLRELLFTAENGFKATWTPFEAYVDYWGSYRFDPATGALSLKAEDGNNPRPEADLDGKAALTPDGLLVLDGIWFGDPAGGARPSCSPTFRKR
jgi:hypothetical protein